MYYFETRRLSEELNQYQETRELCHALHWLLLSPHTVCRSYKDTHANLTFLFVLFIIIIIFN